MGTYRYTRNIEASIIDALTVNFTADWSNINVEKTYARVYEISLPTICVRVGTTRHDPVEIGDNNTWRHAQLLIDVFGSDDGNKLDLTDYIVKKIKKGFIYYDYVITAGVVDTQTPNGRIRVNSMDVTPVNFNDDRNNLDVHDRDRNLITCDITLGKVEA